MMDDLDYPRLWMDMYSNVHGRPAPKLVELQDGSFIVGDARHSSFDFKIMALGLAKRWLKMPLNPTKEIA